MNFRGYESRKLYNLHSLTDLLSNGYEGSSYSVGCGVYVVIIGLILGIAGCFIDIMNKLNQQESMVKDLLPQMVLCNVFAGINHDFTV